MIRHTVYGGGSANCDVCDMLGGGSALCVTSHIKCVPTKFEKKFWKDYLQFQIDMFGNMSIIVLTQIHIMFVHLFGIGSVSSYFLWLKLLLHLKMPNKWTNIIIYNNN